MSIGTLSEDGKFVWDGEKWVPVPEITAPDPSLVAAVEGDCPRCGLPLPSSGYCGGCQYDAKFAAAQAAGATPEPAPVADVAG